jgi:REP-associated tyrosine transposase
MMMYSDPEGIADEFLTAATMSSTYLSLHYHIIFSTKNRQPTIAEAWRTRLHEYLGGIVRGLDGFPEAIGGANVHVHLLVGLRATHSLADFVRELKKAATVWIRDQGLDADFAWQEGYAAFTVSPTARESVKNYVLNQERHHDGRDYLEEVKWLLKEAGVTYDPQYLE